MDCIRVGNNYLDETALLEEVLGMIESSPRLVEEIVFFTSYYHCAAREDLLEGIVQKIGKVFPKLRAMGYRVGVNHLATTGHHDENLEMKADGKLRRQVGFDGQVCQGALCPADPDVLGYVRRSYETLAKLNCDIIWVDDDVRLSGHMPTHGCCLCEYCVQDFSKRFGETFTHASLVAAFDDPDAQRRSTVRRAFMERNTDVIRNLLSVIEQTVHAISPKTELGFMTGDRFWEGYGFAEWATALRGKTTLPVRWRPGGGFYTDERPREMFGKACDLGRQIAALPEFVTVVQSEIENFPYQAFWKSSQSNALEATAYIFSGCTGSAWNILGQDAHRMEEQQPLFHRLRSVVPFWNHIKKLLRNTRLIGVWPAWDRFQLAAGEAGRTQSFFHDVGDSMNRPYSLGEIGIPLCFHPSDALVTVLSGCMPRAMGKQRMEELLAGAVLLDAPAVETLYDMGLGELTGVSFGKTYDFDTREQFTDHPINGKMAGTIRDCRQSFRWWMVPARELVPVDAGVEVLSRLQDYQCRDRGVASTLYTNQLGGKVAVMTYYPWTFQQGADKRYQYQALCDALCSGHMPLTIHTAAKIIPWVRRKDDGQLVIGLLNLSNDMYEKVDLSIRTTATSLRRIHMDNTQEILKTQPGEQAMRCTLNHVQPFSFEVLSTET